MENNKYPHITSTEGVIAGAPRIEGRRLSVGDVIAHIHADGAKAAEQSYELTFEEVTQALHYCANQQCIDDAPGRFCHNCTLRSQQEPPLDLSLSHEVIHDGVTFVKGPNEIFLGTLSELQDDWNGTEWWKKASTLIQKD